jgi:hypothetical protein
MSLFGKPVLPRDLEAALEECGPETIRTVLLHGWANRQGMPEALGQIANPSQERAHALAWLKWKDARQSRLDKVNFWITVVAAAAAVLAAIFAFMALGK